MPESKVIFVVGNSRSGTTMLGRILGSHCDVFTFGELHFFEQMWSSDDCHKVLPERNRTTLVSRLLMIQREGYFVRNSSQDYSDDVNRICGAGKELTAIDAYKLFLDYETSSYGKRIPCEQTPRNVFYIKEILDAFPGARVINVVRDPRDVLLSQKRKWKRRFLGAKNIPMSEALRAWVNYHPITISKLWNSSVAAGISVNDTRVVTLRYEDLLNDPKGRIIELCRFMGIAFEEKMLEVPQVGSSSEADVSERKGINRERAGSWRKGGLDSAELFISQKITESLREKLGYERTNMSPSPLWISYHIASFPVKLAFAFFLNVGRMRNIRETIRRRFLR